MPFTLLLSLCKNKKAQTLKEIFMRRGKLKSGSKVYKTKIGPMQQSSILLGVYGSDKLPKGFSIEFESDTDEIVGQVNAVGSSRGSLKYVLFLNNFGIKEVEVSVREL
jgi:hypothetical protein